jgi:hypothetical protein
MQLLGKIEEAEGEITEEIDKALQFNEQRLQAEGINVGMLIKTLDYWIDDIYEELNRLGRLLEKAQKSKELLKNRLSGAMQQYGIERLSSPTLTISFRKSEAVEVTDENAIPAEYLIQPPAYPGKTRIKEAIKAGITVPGAELVTRSNLQIK